MAKSIKIKKDARYYLGMSFLILSVIMPGLSLIVIPLDIDTTTKGVIIGLLSLGGPEIAIVAAVALLGKDVLNIFKNRFFKSLQRILPSKPAPKFQYYASLSVLVILFILSYVYIYFGYMIPPFFKQPSILVMGDIVFVIAFLAAGPEFWEKIGELFRWKGRLQYPDKS